MKTFLCDYCERRRPRRKLTAHHYKRGGRYYQCSDFRPCAAAWDATIASDARKCAGLAETPNTSGNRFWGMDYLHHNRPHRVATRRYVRAHGPIP